MTAQVHGHDGFPYPGFAEDSGMYHRSRDFWEDAFADVTSDTGWVAWMPDVLRDGNPIFSKLNRPLKRGILLQQVAFSDDPVWFKCWISHFGEPGPECLPYLFVETFISLRARAYFQQLVSHWVSLTHSEADVAKLAERLRHAAADEYQVLNFNEEPPDPRHL